MSKRAVANAAAAIATTTGTVAVGAPMAAGLATTLSSLSIATVNASLAAGANISTLGLVSFESAFAVTNSAFVATPTVIGLAPEGVLAKKDPNVDGFKNLLAAKTDVESLCDYNENDREDKNKCIKAKKTLSTIKKDRRKRLAEAKKAAKAAGDTEKREDR